MLLQVRAKLHDEGYYVDADLSDRTIQKKVREAQLAQYNYILVVGQDEAENNTVNVRTRDNVVHGTKPLQDVLQEFSQLVATYK